MFAFRASLSRTSAMSHAFFIRRENSALAKKTFKKVESVLKVKRYLAESSTSEVSSEIEKNTYYDKYKEKLERRLKELETAGESVELPSKPKPTSTVAQATSAATTSSDTDFSDVRGGSVAAQMKPADGGSSPPRNMAKARSISAFQIRSLNSIVHLDLLRPKTADEIGEIWKSHHLQKDCITASIPVEKYAAMNANAEKFKTFILPLPRESGYEVMFVEFSSHQFQMTSLLNYKTLGESAPAQVTISHYTELEASHDIVLMRGEFDTKFLNVLEVQCLANQLQMYYLAKEGSAHYSALESFTQQPEEFDYNLVINLLKDSGMGFIQQQQEQREGTSADGKSEEPAK